MWAPAKNLSQSPRKAKSPRWRRYLRRWNSQAGGVVRTRVRLSPQPLQLLDILDRSQNCVSHVLQRRRFIEGTHALRRAALFFRAFIVELPVCKTK